MENGRKGPHCDLALVLGQHLDETAHVGALEVVGQVHGHGNRRHGGEWLALSVHHLDGILEVGDPDLVDGDAAEVAGLLDVGEGGFFGHDGESSKVFRPRSRRLPDPDGNETHLRPEGETGVGASGVIEKGLGGMVEKGLGHKLGSGILVLKPNDAVSVKRLEGLVCPVGGVHAQGVVEGVEPLADGLFHDLEVANHLVFVEVVGLDNELHLAGVTVRELALVWVLREHVSVLDVKGLADSIGHGGRGV